MSLNPLTQEEYEAEKQQSRTDDDMKASIDFLNTKSEQIGEMAQLCRSVETGTARQILEHIEFINTAKLAAAGFGKEASAISAARVACDRLIRNERADCKSCELLTTALILLLSNWPPSRDGMDNEPLPVGVKAAREAIEYLGWRPITTAPKDARWLRVKMDSGQEHRAHYAEGDGGSQPAFRGWFIQREFGSGKGGCFQQIETPTHWKPDANEK